MMELSFYVGLIGIPSILTIDQSSESCSDLKASAVFEESIPSLTGNSCSISFKAASLGARLERGRDC